MAVTAASRQGRLRSRGSGVRCTPALTPTYLTNPLRIDLTDNYNITEEMDKLRRSFRSSFRRKEGAGGGGGGGKEEPGGGGGGTRQWPQDEASVKANTCTFEVKYLGTVEVGEVEISIILLCFIYWACGVTFFSEGF